MALTSEQEAELLKLVPHADSLTMVGTAVASVPGVTAEAISKTLTVGGLTTALAQLDDAIALKQAELAATTEVNRAAIAALTEQKAVVLAQRKALLG